MDGLEAVRRIRALEQTKLIPLHQSDYRKQIIIGLSANSDDDTLEEAKLSGFSAFMDKPFRYEKFEKLMKRFGL